MRLLLMLLLLVLVLVLAFFFFLEQISSMGKYNCKKGKKNELEEAEKR